MDDKPKEYIKHIEFVDRGNTITIEDCEIEYVIEILTRVLDNTSINT